MLNHSKQKSFANQDIKISQSKAKELFIKRPVWQSLLIVAGPGIIIAFMQGLFIFVTQIMMVDLIPIDGFHSNQEIWGSNYNAIVDLIKAYNIAHPDVVLPIYNIQDIIKSANSFATPLTMIVTATTLLASQGAAVLYSKALGSKQYHNARNIYNESTIVSMLFCLLMSVLMWGLARFWIEGQAQLPHNYESIRNPLIEQFYKTFSTVAINWSVHYFYVLLVSSFLQSYTLICTYFLNAEGRNKYTTLLVVGSDMIGILIAFFLIYFGRIQMYGAAVATILTYLINVLVFIYYIRRLERRALTCLSIKPNNKIIWNWKEVWMIVYIGLGNFFKNMSIAFSTSFSLQILNGVNESINGSAHALFYSSVNGIVLPIYNLMYLSMIGIVRSARSVTSYVYGVHDFKKVRQTYWITNAYTTAYSIIIFFVVVFLLAGFKIPGSWGEHGPFILIFNLGFADNPQQYRAVQYLLMIYLLQLPFFGFANAGELLFQSTEKALLANICSLLQGVFVLIPVLFIMKKASLDIHSVEPSLWVPAIDGIITSIIIGIISVTYMYTRFKKEEIKTLAADKQLLHDKAEFILNETK